jgi:alcohol dehydrogenase class IV
MQDCRRLKREKVKKVEFDFYMPVKTVSGPEAVLENAAMLNSFGKRCLMVTSGSSARLSGALNDMQAALTSEGIEYQVFNGIGQNPLISACYAAGVKARAFGADFIVGIGGGSPQDASKAVAIYAANANLQPSDIYKREYDNAPLPLILVGTTAGTGSEVTSVAVLTVDETGRKKSISGPDCYAKLAFTDPKYTYSVPYDVTVSTALDAFSHAAEAWFTPNCNGIIKVFDQKGLPILWTALKALYKTCTLPTTELREDLYYGSLYAGLVINSCGTAYPHPLGYVMTEKYGVPHGKACALFLPSFFDRADTYEPAKFTEFLDLLGTDKDTLCSTIKAMTGFADVHITDVQAAHFAGRWAKDTPKNFLTSPGGLTAKDAEDILANL